MGSSPTTGTNQIIRKNRLPNVLGLDKRFFVILRDVEYSKIYKEKFKIYLIYAHYATRNTTRKEGIAKSKPLNVYSCNFCITAVYKRG